MPELPDVEVRRLYLERTSLDRKIARVEVLEKRILDNVTPSSLGRGLSGAKFLAAHRRGKYLYVPTDNGNTLLMHFGMGGELVFRDKKSEPKPKWSRVEFFFDRGACLHYTNMRLIGKVALYPTLDESEIPDIAKLGPEPLERGFTYQKFRDVVRGHQTTIHQLLMDQELIAGIGNEYSDEITYQAGIRPDRKTSSLADADIRRLFDKMKWTLRRSIALGAELGGHPDRFIIPNRGRDGVCPGGHGKLVKKTIGGRSSYFCPACQK